jgi:hypothetical protein
MRAKFLHPLASSAFFWAYFFSLAYILINKPQNGAYKGTFFFISFSSCWILISDPLVPEVDFFCIMAGAGEAVDEHGNLKDARDIVWYHDRDDAVPIASGSNLRMSKFLWSLWLFWYLLFLMPGTTSGRARNTARMTEILEAEALSSDTNNNKRRRRKRKGKTKETGIDSEDAQYADSSSDSGTSSDEDDKSDEVEISNKEVSLIPPITYSNLTWLFAARRITPLKNYSCWTEAVIDSRWQETETTQKTSAKDCGGCRARG